MSEKYKTLKVKELQELLQKNSLPTTGKKEELVARLVKDDERKALENLEKEFEMDGDFDESKISLSDIPADDIFALEKLPLIEKESVLSDNDDDDDVEYIFNSKRTAKAASPPSKNTTASSNTAASPVINSVAAHVIVEKTEIPKKKTVASGNTTAAATTKITSKITATTNTTSRAITTSTQVNSVKATVSSSFKFTPITFDEKPTVVATSTSKAAAVTAPPVVTKTPKPKFAPVVAKPVPVPPKKLDDKAEKLRLEAERRLERSKRFGVKLDENEMKKIRAARFGITPTPAAATLTSTKTTNSTTTKNTKSKEKAVNKKENNSKKKALADPQPEILKRRAERFGLPEKKIQEEEKPAKKRINKKVVDTKPKKAPVKKIQKGRITKANVSTPTIKANNNNNNNKTKKNITVNVTKDNVLNKKQKNVNMLNKEGIILRNKMDIINQRRIKIANKNAPIMNNGRIITIAPKTNKAAPTPANPRKRARNDTNVDAATVNRRSVVVNPNANQRHITIARAQPAPKNAGSKNNNNSATRKRGPGTLLIK